MAITTFMKNNPSVLNEFDCYLLSKNFSDKTVISYNADILIFFNFLKDYNDIPISIREFNLFLVMHVKKSDIYAFMVYLNMHKDNSPATRQRRLASIRHFYKWLFRIKLKNFDKPNPTYGIGNIGKVERLPKTLSLKEAKEIQKCFNSENSANYLRNNTIISLFLSTGIRISELVSINESDINFEEKSIRIIGKGNKERKVYFNSLCKDRLLEYIEFKKVKDNNQKNSKSIPLFINKDGGRLTTASVENVCKQAFSLIGIRDKDYTAHTLRHTAATLIYKYVKPDILLLKEFLGHSSVLSTEIYTHIYNDDLKKAVNKNPLSNFKVKNKKKEGKRDG